jgi:hypothetical protein
MSHEYVLLYIIGPLAHKYPGPAVSTSAYGIDTYSQQQYQNSYKYV